MQTKNFKTKLIKFLNRLPEDVTITCKYNVTNEIKAAVYCLDLNEVCLTDDVNYTVEDWIYCYDLNIVNVEVCE